jgi:hypothetical protein
MSDSCTVVIGAPEHLDALRKRADGEVLAFPDREVAKALEAITTRRPAVVVLERLFAATSRGAALINRIKVDPDLTFAEIRIVAHDGSYSRVSARRQPAAPVAAAPSAADAPPAPPPSSIDYRGTRRAARYRVVQGTGALVDGAEAEIIDLSAMGAQVLVRAALRPQQRIRVALSDDSGVVKLNAEVAWVRFEIPKSTPRYRAGVQFRDPDPDSIEAFCKRHQRE